MQKTDLLDELRSQVGLVLDRCYGPIKKIYPAICEQIVDQMPNYQGVGIYIVESTFFKKYCGTGTRSLPAVVPFGEGLLSIAAVRGGMVQEKSGNKMEVYVPFYQGHHLQGELVMISDHAEQIDDEDITFFCELASFLESKIKKGK